MIQALSELILSLMVVMVHKKLFLPDFYHNSDIANILLQLLTITCFFGPGGQIQIENHIMQCWIERLLKVI